MWKWWTPQSLCRTQKGPFLQTKSFQPLLSFWVLPWPSEPLALTAFWIWNLQLDWFRICCCSQTVWLSPADLTHDCASVAVTEAPITGLEFMWASRLTHFMPHWTLGVGIFWRWKSPLAGQLSWWRWCPTLPLPLPILLTMTQAGKQFPSPLTSYFLVTVELSHLTLGDKDIQEGLSRQQPALLWISKAQCYPDLSFFLPLSTVLIHLQKKVVWGGLRRVLFGGR